MGTWEAAAMAMGAFFLTVCRRQLRLELQHLHSRCGVYALQKCARLGTREAASYQNVRSNKFKQIFTLNEISRRVLLENTKRNLLPDTGFVVKNVSSRRSSGISNSMVVQNQRTRPGHTRYEVLLSELAKLKQELLQDVRLVLRDRKSVV